MSAVLFGLAVLKLNLMIQPCPFQVLILRGDVRLDFNIGRAISRFNWISAIAFSRAS
jgi:hypothetical protein